LELVINYLLIIYIELVIENILSVTNSKTV